MNNNAKATFSGNFGKQRIIFITVCALALLFFSVLMWGIKEAEIGFLIWHNSVFENPAALAWWKWITRYGLNIICFTEGLIIFISLKYERLRVLQPALFCALVTYAIGWLAGDALKEWIGRVRPAAELAGQIANTYVSDSPSYPSGHATKAMTLVLPYVFLAPKAGAAGRVIKIFLMIVALLVSYSRITLQLHYPSDIIAGAGLACALTLVALPPVRMMISKWTPGFNANKYFYMYIGSVFLFLAVIFLFI